VAKTAKAPRSEGSAPLLRAPWGRGPGTAGRVRGNFPIRRAIQIALGVAITVFVVLGAYRTLTLPVKGGRLSGAAWRDLVVYGVAQGAVIALIALGYSLVYGILFMINFAHGEVFMSGAYASFFVALTMDQSGFLNRDPVVAILILIVVAMAVSTFIAVLLERIAYRPLRNAPRLVPLITAIGASLFLQNTFRAFFGSQARGYPNVTTLEGRWTILGIPVLKTNAIVIATAVLAMVALTLFVSRTKTGKAMRAVATDKEIASLMGINVDRIIVTTFAIGGIMAGIAGVLFALVFGFVKFDMGFLPGIAAFTAAVLGGIGSITGAALGGLIIGILQSVAPALLLLGFHVPSPNQLKDVVSFSILVLVLIFRPGGILGGGEAEKV
jgi:branched-chain amino acid transport system permease protein